MNIAAIQTFLTVTRSGNLNRAAAELNVTQSAVTARLDSLEATLGVRLLNRSRKGATLTKDGYAFLDQAELIVNTWANARARANLPRGVTRLFSFVCAPGLWSGLAEPWIAGLRKDHPETAFEIWSASAEDARRWLGSGLSDAALLSEPLTAPDIETRPFVEDRLIQVATRPRRAVAWDPAYVMVDYGPAFRSWHRETWPGDETAAMAFSTPDWALAHLLHEGGSAYLPEGQVAPLIEAGRLFPVKGAPSCPRRSHLNWRSASATAFAWLSD